MNSKIFGNGIGVGDYCNIIDDNSCHGYEIGELVQVVEIYYDPEQCAFYCVNIDQVKRAVYETDLKKIRQE